MAGKHMGIASSSAQVWDHLAANLGGAHKDDLANVGGGDQRIARLTVAGDNLQSEARSPCSARSRGRRK